MALNRDTWMIHYGSGVHSACNMGVHFACDRYGGLSCGNGGLLFVIVVYKVPL